uniref:Reverse transcriptase domain-containing protein n=1 Tax=Cyprinodon variegatus TaxID=28743 RepID=A0A3Q2GMA1_CYPVA
KGVDGGSTADISLQDVTSAFNTVNHLSLLDRLRSWAGISGPNLKWLSSYLSDRSTFLATSLYSSYSYFVPFGVPLSSVLGTLLFLISCHCYADIIQLHISFPLKYISKLYILSRRLLTEKDYCNNNRCSSAHLGFWPFFSDLWHQQGISAHRTAAHWMFFLFLTILCKP